MSTSRPPITSGETARRLGVSVQYLAKLDPRLAPSRTARGVRLYDPDVVDVLAAERAARRS
ncbi:MAG: hypothetical protein JO257_06035 [Deltaproteobacteria bacterium]|nr:hypothetical protein [Deltaproteobacteria bacterium]